MVESNEMVRVFYRWRQGTEGRGAKEAVNGEKIGRMFERW